MFVVALAAGAFMTAGVRASDLAVTNASLDGSGGTVQGWDLHNASVSTDDGKSFVKLPAEKPDQFAKLWQRMSFDGNKYKSLKVVARVRAVNRSDLGAIEQSLPKPRLRIFYFPADTKWTYTEVLWPEGKSGANRVIEPSEEWREVSFDLDCPEAARNLEIAVEADNPGYAVEVDEVSVEATPRS